MSLGRFRRKAIRTNTAMAGTAASSRNSGDGFMKESCLVDTGVSTAVMSVSSLALPGSAASWAAAVAEAKGDGDDN